MNPEILASIGVLRGVIAAVLLVTFIALWLCTFSRRRRAMFETLAQLPLEDDVYRTEPARGVLK